MKKLILCFIVIASIAKQSHAQTYVAIPDSNFVHYLKTIIPTAFKGDSLNTSSTLVTTTVHKISVDANNISNLNGIQYFLSLDTLGCGNNHHLTNIPALPNTLEVLTCYNDSLIGLPALPNTLTYLDCGRNFITTLPSLPNAITYLNLGDNFLNTLPTLPNSLQIFICENNQLTSLPSLPNTLYFLDALYNNISCFPTFPSSITTCTITSNPYNCLPNFVLPAMNSYTTTPLCAAGNSNGCPIAYTTSIEQYNDNTITIYPNPNNGSFVIESNNATKQTMQVYDVNGKLVLSQMINGRTSIDASSLAEGVYNISLQSNEGVANKRLVIVR